MTSGQYRSVASLGMRGEELVSFLIDLGSILGNAQARNPSVGHTADEVCVADRIVERRPAALEP
jgi:hypothetical protein